MAIPPNDNEPEKYFQKISELNKNLTFKTLALECPMTI